MMSKQRSISVLTMKAAALLILSGSAIAANDRPQRAYVALGMGSSNFIDDDKYEDFDVDQFGFGWSVSGGYHFFRHFALELGYMDFGRFQASNRLADIEEDFAALYLAGMGTLPLSERWHLYGKLGVAALRQQQSFSFQADDTRTDAAFMLGIGTLWAPETLPRWAFTASYDSFSFETEFADETFWNSTGLAALGARYTF